MINIRNIFQNSTRAYRTGVRLWIFATISTIITATITTTTTITPVGV